MGNPTINIPSEQTDLKNWRVWYDDLRGSLPLQDANEVFVAYWEDRGKNKDDNNFRTYMKGYGVNLSSNILEKTSDLGHGITRGIGNFIGTSKTVFMIVGGVLLVSVLGIIVNVAKNPIGAMNSAAKFTPSGALSKL
ncbi:MAG: hypothetical protein HC892_01535 [Saprospiraceae bacterium]|nr:hypothetical protein [Saprospiraceae bacterium]